MILCLHNILWLIIVGGGATFACFISFYFLFCFACLALTASVACFAILLFVYRIYFIKNNRSKYEYSNYAMFFFKMDWTNTYILGIAKIAAIFVVNNKNGLNLDFNALFLIFATCYLALFALTSDFVIKRVFYLQQGFILIINQLDSDERQSYETKRTL